MKAFEYIKENEKEEKIEKELVCCKCEELSKKSDEVEVNRKMKDDVIIKQEMIIEQMEGRSFNQYEKIRNMQIHVSQLESSNTYRQEVIRLEAALENQEKVQREQESKIEGKEKKIDDLEQKV